MRYALIMRSYISTISISAPRSLRYLPLESKTNVYMYNYSNFMILYESHCDVNRNDTDLRFVITLNNRFSNRRIYVRKKLQVEDVKREENAQINNILFIITICNCNANTKTTITVIANTVYVQRSLARIAHSSHSSDSPFLAVRLLHRLLHGTKYVVHRVRHFEQLREVNVRCPVNFFKDI